MSNVKESNTVSGGKIWVPELPAVQAKVAKRVKLAAYLSLIAVLGMITTLIVTLINSNATVETTNNSMTFIPYVTPLSTIIIMVVFGIIGILLAIYTRDLTHIIMVCFVSVMMIIPGSTVGAMKAVVEKHQVCMEDP